MWIMPRNEDDSISKDYQKKKHCGTGYLCHTCDSGLYSHKRNYSIILIRGVTRPRLYFRKFPFMAVFRLWTTGRGCSRLWLTSEETRSEKGKCKKEGTNLMAI